MKSYMTRDEKIQLLLIKGLIVAIFLTIPIILTMILGLDGLIIGSIIAFFLFANTFQKGNPWDK